MAMVSRRAHLPRLLVGAAILGAGCAHDSVGLARAVPPVIDDATVQAGPHNVLSAVVSAHLREADSARVSFKLDESTAGDSVTPVAPVVDGSVIMPVLGLLPDRRYALHVIAYGPK